MEFLEKLSDKLSERLVFILLFRTDAVCLLGFSFEDLTHTSAGAFLPDRGSRPRAAGRTPGGAPRRSAAR